MLLPSRLLRLEGLALFVGALVVYFDQGYAWWLLVVLFLAPDLFFAGYLAGPRLGASIYNAFHTTVGPIALASIGVLSDTDWCIQLALSGWRTSASTGCSATGSSIRRTSRTPISTAFRGGTLED